MHPGELVREGVVFAVESVGDGGQRKIIWVDAAAKTDPVGEGVLEAADNARSLCVQGRHTSPP